MDCVHVDKNDRIYLIFLSIYSPANKWASDDANRMHAELRLHPNTSPLFEWNIHIFRGAGTRENAMNRREINALAFYLPFYCLLVVSPQCSLLIHRLSQTRTLATRTRHPCSCHPNYSFVSQLFFSEYRKKSQRFHDVDVGTSSRRDKSASNMCKITESRPFFSILVIALFFCWTLDYYLGSLKIIFAVNFIGTAGVVIPIASSSSSSPTLLLPSSVFEVFSIHI